ncbi:MAG: hypothetical protein ABIV43_03275 [Candidatus Saccharimonadales bacterium]
MIRPEDTPEYKTGSKRELPRKQPNIALDLTGTKLPEHGSELRVTPRGKIALGAAAVALVGGISAGGAWVADRAMNKTGHFQEEQQQRQVPQVVREQMDQPPAISPTSTELSSPAEDQTAIVYDPASGAIQTVPAAPKR